MSTLAESVYKISDSDRQEFWREGHILLRSVAEADVIGKYRQDIADAAFRYSTETRDMDERDTYGKAFLQVTNLWQHDEKVREFVFNTRFARIAADLLGVENVRLYHDQALIKEPGGGPTPWHQDMYYWPLDSEKTVTMWMPLVDIDEQMGMLTFASGSHANKAAGNVGISDESESFYGDHISEKGYPIAKADSMQAGDATFHLGWTIHSAGANLSTDRSRQVMTVIYYADGTLISPPVNKHQQADLDAWLGGLSSGSPANGPLNPILT
ncbi:MAG: phytanoyl-CoA dioxygenase family protein [Acidobacteria bacterium]|nr:phytanoyl-CoA dioxygenase family protein [Acidobacteriota bacterium]